MAKLVSNGTNERLTWKEIKKKYPDQWLGLTDVDYDDDIISDDETDLMWRIKSAVVSYVGYDRDTLQNANWLNHVEMAIVRTQLVNDLGSTLINIV